MDEDFRKLTLDEAIEMYGDFYKMNTVWICPKCKREWENETVIDYEWGCPVDFTPLVFGYARHYPDESDND